MSKVTSKSNKKQQSAISFDGKSCWVGVDTHKVNYAVAILDEDGQRVEFSTPADPKILLKKFITMGIRIKCLAYESGPVGFGLAWACQESKLPVLVAAPSRIPRPITKSGKTDRLDSMKLVEFLAKGMLVGIAIPTKEEFALREIERTRQHLTERRRKTRQEIRSFLLRNGIQEPPNLSSWGKISIESLKKLELAKNLRISLDYYLEEHATIISQLENITAQLDKSIAEHGLAQQVKNLRTVPGVGKTIANTFSTEIFRPERFNRPEQICSFVGLAPITSHSGLGREKAWTRSVGQVYLKSALIQGAWKLIMSDEWYKSFYDRIRLKTGCFQKALVAIARKLLVIVWRLSIEKREYHPSNCSLA